MVRSHPEARYLTALSQGPVATAGGPTRRSRLDRVRAGRSSAGLAGFRFGPGPAAETFPDPLAPLEVSLWVEPLSQAVVEALHLVGIGRRRLTRSPVAVVVDGRVALDLDLVAPGSGGSILSRLDPRGPARRLRVAWRVGRLAGELPGLAEDLVVRVDSDLAAIGPLTELSDRELLNLLRRSNPSLRALHGHEMLAGLVRLEEGASLASLAVAALGEAQARGLKDDDVIVAAPVVLALTPPAIGRRAPLPDIGPVVDVTGNGVDRSLGAGLSGMGPREALRLRIRWVQELTARVAGELGRRLRDRGVLDSPAQVALLTLPELELAVSAGRRPTDLGGRRRPVSPPLPIEFRFDDDGRVVPLSGPDRSGGRGQPAAPGRAVGPVHSGDDVPDEGAVLVVTWLDPRLAPMLSFAGALVSETGTPESHLCILAREWGIPAVVGVSGATDRFPHGTVVTVDGDRGEVREVPG